MRVMSDKYIIKNKKTIIKGIQEFLDNPRTYDYETFTKTRELVLRDSNQAARFAYEFLGKEAYEKFMDKALPFEPYFYEKNTEDKEALKETISKVAMAVRVKKGNLIDIVDVGCRNLYQYLSMVRQLSYKYKTIPTSAYVENCEYLKNVISFDNDDVTATTEISGADAKAVDEILESRGLKINGITRSAAYSYLKRTNTKKETR